VVSNDGGAASSAVYIRGIGSNIVGIGGEPGVGVYIGGVYQGRMQGLDLDMMDIARVEILRGPQGTLYGKNTVGGAINIIPGEPDSDAGALGGHVAALAGNFRRADALININVPIVDDIFALRFAAATRNDDGYGHRLLSDQSMGNTGKLSGRLSALYTPSEAWKVLVNIDGTRIRQHNADFGLTAIGTPALVGLYNRLFTPLYNSQWIPTNRYDNFGTGANQDDADLWGADVTTTWHTGAFDLKAITAYRHNRTNVGLDPDGSPVTILDISTAIAQHQFSQELQMTGSSFSGRFQWVGGVYYFQEAASETTWATVFPTLAPVVGDLTFYRVSTTDNRAYAAYGQGSFALHEDLHLTVGARYTNEPKSATFFQQTLLGGVVTQPLFHERATFNHVSPRVGLDYQWTPEMMTYVSAAEGYKSGGFNNTNLANVFNPEKARTYEAGLRSDWLNKTLRVNATLFYSDYKDIQVSESYATPGGRPLSLIANAATATIKGGELEIEARPMRALMLSANAGYTDAAFTSAVNTSGIGLPPVTSASPFVNVPRWTYGASTELSMPIPGGRYALIARADYNYRTRVFHDISGSTLTSQPAYGLLNARLTFEPTDDHWSISAFGTNITNQHFITAGTDFTGSLGFATVVEGPPAQWGIDLRYRF
jgi:iron complex outermembrane receptor protein